MFCYRIEFSQSGIECSGQPSFYLCFYSFSFSYSDPPASFYRMADDKETKLRPKKSFQFKLPKIRFGSELHVPDISAPMGVKPIVSIVVDKDTGTLDLNSVPAEFQELAQKLYENISKPKTVMKIEEKAEDEVVKIS